MADLKTLEMPKYGLSMTEGTVANWLVEPGQSFDKGQEVCEVETSKITNVFEAPFAATLYAVIAPKGTVLPVGAPMAVVGEAGATPAEVEAFVAALSGAKEPEPAVAAPAKAEAKAAPKAAPAPAPKAAATVAALAKSIDKPAAGATVVPAALKGETPEGVNASSRALRLAQNLGISLALVTGSGAEGRISVEDIEVAVRAAGGSVAAPAPAERAKVESHADDSAVPATPVARRLAQKLGVNLNDCRATGTQGRVCRDDVLLAAQKLGKLEDAPASVTAAVPQPAEDPVVTPMSGMRRAIGARLVQSKLEAPHFRLTTEIDMSRLNALRKEINADVPGVKISVNDLLIKAVAAALIKVPDVNVCYDAEQQAIVKYPDADISVAVALNGGLITPIVKAANRKSVTDISKEVVALVTKAKAGTLQPEEFQGGSFSISNLGMFGITQFDAIINPPQGAILAVGAAIDRAVPVKGQVEIRPILTATLSCDHRVIDGALGAQFLKELKRFAEAPNLMLV
ncbi:diaminohydroxyphosphoribosylaminopyrimidine deaminase [Sinirhodobacter populi]|uniref:Dihydrolipoamide acetyltransferase component of pyruvate dehydrogenase complex n=1 Tax=Paenirhodobacter populi TaxID=2306993 RepID=A0A443K5N2_9RHOB|nr:2-oxo acid dehydrogenase subunit E2 [Sinirhodobacter populi]RWR28060.1 diaminohydroxyphosphoribosylaminopyrimidine deaminase [Sinirhodobacter populi]